MRWTLIAALVSTVALMSACKSSQDRQLADVPPPPPSTLDQTASEPMPLAPVESMAPSPTVTFDQPAPQPIPAPAAGGSYTIRKGDTLWSIAARHYGDGKMWTQIVDANPGLDPKKLAVGQVISLP